MGSETLTGFGLVLALAVVVEGVIEYFGASLPSMWKKYAAMAFGVILTVLWGADVFALMGAPSPVPYAGSIVTGLLIGRGSSYMHELLGRRRFGVSSEALLVPTPGDTDRNEGHPKA